MQTAKHRAQEVVRAVDVALRALARIGKPYEAALALLEERKGKILTSGVGKSSFIAMKAAATLTSLGHRAVYLDPLAALHGDSGIVERGDVLIAFSFSGESVELVRLARHVRALKGKVLAMTHGRASSLAGAAHAVLDVPVAQEGSPHNLAPMASTTTSLVLADMLAAGLTRPEEFNQSAFARFHPAGSLGLALIPVSRVMRKKKDVPSIPARRTVAEALAVMTRGGLGTVAVTDKNRRLVGVITDGDVRRILLEHDAPKSLIVQDVMGKKPKSISSNATLLEALSLMEKHKITNVLVVNGDAHLVGILHMHDIIERGL